MLRTAFEKATFCGHFNDHHEAEMSKQVGLLPIQREYLMAAGLWNLYISSLASTHIVPWLEEKAEVGHKLPSSSWREQQVSSIEVRKGSKGLSWICDRAKLLLKRSWQFLFLKVLFDRLPLKEVCWRRHWGAAKSRRTRSPHRRWLSHASWNSVNNSVL